MYRVLHVTHRHVYRPVQAVPLPYPEPMEHNDRHHPTHRRDPVKRAGVAAIVAAAAIGGYAAGISQQADVTASIKAQTRAEVRAAVCQALDNAQLSPFVWQPDDVHKAAANVVEGTDITGPFRVALSTPRGCRQLFR